MSWRGVRAWLRRLREADVSAVPTGLSPAGLREALDVALDALDEATLARAASMSGAPWPEATVVVAGTVPTAAIEWLALLLGRGTRVRLKHSAAHPGLNPLLGELAGDLPLSITPSRDAVRGVPFVVAMGGDETMQRIATQVDDGAVFQPHGHRFSAAWITGTEVPHDPLMARGFDGPWQGVATDAALHDGRGCLSPSLVFTPLPLDEATQALSAAMARAAARWPTGALDAAEHAAIRTRRALAKAAGVAWSGEGCSVHGLPAHLASPAGLPRSVALVHVRDLDEALATVAPWSAWLSTVGTDDARAAPRWTALGASRVCWPGRMQRPPVFRLHDGVDWVRSTVMPAP